MRSDVKVDRSNFPNIKQAHTVSASRSLKQPTANTRKTPTARLLLSLFSYLNFDLVLWRVIQVKGKTAFTIVAMAALNDGTATGASGATGVAGGGQAIQALPVT